MRVLFDLKVTKSVATVSRQKEQLCRSIALWQETRTIEDEKETRKQQLKMNFYPLYQKLMMTKKINGERWKCKKS
ncbi:unnamed protein product, partial [Amoebophrya sp. A120]|eukprot:GSA120T00025463001.1